MRPALLCSAPPSPELLKPGSLMSWVARASSAMSHSTAPSTTAACSRQPGAMAVGAPARAPPGEVLREPSGKVMGAIVAQRDGATRVQASGAALSTGALQFLQHDGAVL